MNKIEGSLDIFWMNQIAPAATPKYQLHFTRYIGFQSGAQPSKLIVGNDGLKSYLTELGFTPQDAETWTAQVHENRSVSIPNVMLPEQYLAPYLAPSA